MKKTWVWGIGLLLLGGVWWPQEVHARSSLQISRSGQKVLFTIDVSARRFQRMRHNGWHFHALVWVQEPGAWRRLLTQPVPAARWRFAYGQAQLCQRVVGHAKVALQLSVSYRGWWWNRWTKRFQKVPIAVREQLVDVPCPSAHNFPPGSPSRLNQPNTPALPMTPPTQLLPSGTQDPSTHVPNNPLLSERAFLSFRRTLRRAVSDQNRMTQLKAWTGQLGKTCLRARHVVEILRLFSAERSRAKAAKMLSRYVIRPLRVRQVVRILKRFLKNQRKLEVAPHFCKGVADPLSLHRLSRLFWNAQQKKKILQLCK